MLVFKSSPIQNALPENSVYQEQQVGLWMINLYICHIYQFKYMEYNSSKFDYFDLHVLINLMVFKLVKKSFA